MNENIVLKDMETEYDNSGRVENSSELIANFIADAADYRNEAARRIDFGQSYGPRERNKLDLFWPGTNKADDKPDKTAPIVMFIHGGYWQRLDRSAFSHMAKGLNAHGIAVAIPSYTLCPEITISGIIDEIRRACIVLWKTYGSNITVTGHSAGGHLAACMIATNWNRIHNALPDDLVQSALSISGVFELAPLIETSHNEALKLTEEEARTASPYNWIIEPDTRFDAWVGGIESSEFLRQSRSQTQRWRMMGAKTAYREVPRANHFTAVAPLTNPDSPMVKRLLEMLEPEEPTTLDDLKIPEHQPMPVDIRADRKSPDTETEKKQDDAEDQAEKVVSTESIEPEINNAPPEKAKQDAPTPSDEGPKPEEAETEKQPEDNGAEAGVASEDKPTEAKVEQDGDDETPANPEEKTKPENNDKPQPAEAERAAPEKPENQAKPDNEDNDGDDDLTFIAGIGTKTQARLNDIGYSRFVQIAELSETQRDMIEDILDINGQIEADNWITQARHLNAQKELGTQ